MKTVAELDAIRAEIKDELALRHGGGVCGKYTHNIMVCGGTGCHSSNSFKIIDALNEEIAAKGIQDKVEVVMTGCFGL